MQPLPARALRAAALCLAAALLYAQDWKSSASLPGVDLSGLAPAQQTAALRLLRGHGCSCGCGMKLAECRVQDPTCHYSRGLASVIVSAIRQGRSEAEALAAAGASQFSHVPGRDTRVLGDPVSIPTAGSPRIGPRNARITLVEFSDFQCPYCRAATPQLQAVLKTYPTQVKLIFKQYPLDRHSQAALAAAAALAAHKQGKFWPLHDALFANRGSLSRQAILALAAGLGLDLKRLESDLDSPEIKQAVARDIEDGDRAGVEGTPTLFINGRRYNGAITLEALKPVLDAELQHPHSVTAALHSLKPPARRR
jgi:protein-disulfide isomerase